MASSKRSFEKDHSLKAMSERDPVGLLRVLLGIPWDVPMRVVPERRELSLRFQVDELLRAFIRGSEGLYHLEGESNFATAAADRAMQRTAAVGIRFGVPVNPMLVLYNPNRPARDFGTRRKMKFGRLELRAQFQVVRLWRRNPREILARRRIHLMPMVAAMNSTRAQIHEAAMRIEAVRDPDERKRLRQEMATFLAVRYNEAEANDLIGGNLNMMPPLEVVRDSDIGRKIEQIGRFEGRQRGKREGRKQGHREGKEEGLREGEQVGQRKLLFNALLHKFPGIGLKESDLPLDEAALDRLMREMLHTNDTAKMRRLVLEANRS